MLSFRVFTNSSTITLVCIRNYHMSKKTPLSNNELSLFRDAVKGVKKLKQDTINPVRRHTGQLLQQKRTHSIERNHAFYFSDEFEPLLNEEGPTQYARSDVSKYELKRLRRGIYVPDMFLDLHGLTQVEAKRELAALISACIKENVSCACIMHGIGKHILKKKTPLWLAQHPNILAFHQAPLEFGGNGSLLVLIELAPR